MAVEALVGVTSYGSQVRILPSASADVAQLGEQYFYVLDTYFPLQPC